MPQERRRDLLILSCLRIKLPSRDLTEQSLAEVYKNEGASYFDLLLDQGSVAEH